MPSTVTALLVFVVALLPGALYVWSFERIVGRWGIGLSDRVFRFVAGSAIFHALFAPLSYWFWARQWPRLHHAQPVSWGLWLLALLYVVAPVASGYLVGHGVRNKRSWTRWLVGPDPAPRAWDHLFEHGVEGWVRFRLKSGVWLGGAFATANGRRSYAAGYPEQQDLYIAAVANVDPETGEFIRIDDGPIDLQPGGILVRWEEIEYLEFLDLGTEPET